MLDFLDTCGFAHAFARGLGLGGLGLSLGLSPSLQPLIKLLCVSRSACFSFSSLSLVNQLFLILTAHSLKVLVGLLCQ
jgi:hypothetical protein